MFLYLASSSTFLDILDYKWVTCSLRDKSSENQTPKRLLEGTNTICPLFNARATGMLIFLFILLNKTGLVFFLQLSQPV